MQKPKLLFALLIALFTAQYANAQVSLKIKLSSPEHGVQEFTYDVPVPPVEPIAIPTASHASGAVELGTAITLSCSTEGATIHYTLDGSTPTSNSDKYTTPIIISGTVNIKAIATKEGMDNSEVLTVEYSIADITRTIEGVTFTMKIVAGGTFTMGCTGEQDSYYCYSDESPTHQVTLSSYYMGETEVTQALWQAVMGSNPPYLTSDGLTLPVDGVSWEDIVGTSGSAVGYTVNGVTYYQNGFCYKLSQLVGGGKQFRLPTEAEWEYAARGGNKATTQTKYSGSNFIEYVAWYNAFSGSTSHAVKTRMENALGLYDMSGNVSEWCSDWYGAYSSSEDPQINPSGAAGSGKRVFRGGYWGGDAWDCRVSARNFIDPDYNVFIGFRLAL